MPWGRSTSAARRGSGTAAHLSRRPDDPASVRFKDKYTENHSYRVSVMQPRLRPPCGSTRNGLKTYEAASLLHDIGKLDTSGSFSTRQPVHRSRIPGDEEHIERCHILEPWRSCVGSSRSFLPITTGSTARDIVPRSRRNPLGGSHHRRGDVYDSLTSDRPYRKAMSPFEAKEVIAKDSGAEFDPSCQLVPDRVPPGRDGSSGGAPLEPAGDAPRGQSTRPAVFS